PAPAGYEAMRPAAQPSGYEAMRPAAPRPNPAPPQQQHPYEDPYNRPYRGGY
ncbi:DUF6643 family protein, partial [Streptomyces sp. ZG43]